MCGNVGVILLDNKAFLTTKECKFFEQALHVDALRGVDATGVSIIDNFGDVETFKKAVPSQIFLKDKTVMYKINSSNTVALLGHNRWATTGSLDDTGAHPFTHGDITLFHNGTLHHWYKISKENFKIDSEAICAGFSENGAKATLEKLDGAYALVWYNKRESTVNFARNKERPLYFGTIKNRNVLLYASEKGMIEWLADRNNLALESVNQLEIGKLLSINIKNNSKPTITNFKILEPKRFNNYYPDYYNYDDYGYGYKNKSNKSKYENTNPLSKILFKNIKVVFNTFISYHNGNNIVRKSHKDKKVVGYSKRIFGYLEGVYKDINGETHKIKSAGISEEEAETILNEHFTICKITTLSNDGAKAFVKILTDKELQSLDLEKSLKETDNVLKKTDKSLATTKEDVYIGAYGSKVDSKILSLTANKGCKSCKCKIDIKDHYSYGWIQNNLYCFDCFTYEVY